MSDVNAKTIFVVDDDINILDTSKMILETLGYNVQTAQSGSEAVHTVEANPNSFDLVLTDMSMPDLDGPELLVKLRECGFSGPVALVSGHVIEQGDVSDDFAGIIFKPFHMNELATQIQKFLDS